ncbi:MAG TPA: PD40 domain-containing protein [Candidatus Coprenecus merdigallinarum]|nr:PD40 domain-containing protein [Candidatus Coprenecus merdigallinarum]
MKRIFRIFLGAAMLLSASTMTALAQEPSEGPLWMRYSAISPDGSTIAFAYKGDIFTVPVTGGQARQITSNSAFDSRPVWSPDGSRIAFVSYRQGGADVYIVSREGGEPTRLTTHSAAEFPVAFKDDSTILYSAYIQPAAESMQFPSSTFSQVYAVSTEGGRPVMFSTLPLENISFSPDGKTLLYNDKKGYEDEWRKHHTSSIARDIWSCTFDGENVRNGKFTQITTFDGEDRDPVYAPDGKSFYWLSEQDGTFNVWKHSFDGGADKQITHFKGNPVRFLTIAQNGTLCFGYDGEIYTVKEGAEPQKVAIEIIADKQDRDLIKQPVYYAQDIAVSKDGKQVAFIYRGDVYVTMTDYATTKRITNTAEQERNIDFAPDGRSLIYSSERDGLWQVYKASIVDDSEKLFPYCTEIKEERVTNSDVPSFQPLYSPDGKEIAFLENRTTIRVINLDTKEVRTVMDGKYEYSYSDGDQWYQWSPDGKWILSNCIFIGGWNNKDVALVNASGNGEMYNLTQSGYTDANAKWVLDGKAMIWASDRAGYRSHGSWGAESDVYIMFFDLEAYEKFRMSEEELALYEEEQKIKKEAEEKAAAEDKDKKSRKDKKSKKDDEEKAEEAEPLKLDLENAEYRVMRLTVNSSNLGDAVLSKDGKKLYYLASFEGGMDLWVHDLKENTTRILSKGAGYGSLILSDDGNSIFMNTGRIKKINVASGEITPIEMEGVFEYKPYAERQYMFDHAWRQVKEKFYDPDIHGVDWDGYRTTYGKFLPYINNNFDFAEMLGELLGELNGSHTGARYYGGGASYPTAYLGLFYDDTYTGDGLKIKEIIRRSPLTQFPNDVKPGCIIEEIDGEPILAGQDYFPLLEGKVGERIRLTVYDPETSKRFDVEIKGLGSEGGILYQRWVERNRDIVDSISGGKIGYVHIQGMDSPSFRTLYSELLGRLRHKDAVVVDTRHNGGGWLHDDVVTLLSGKEYQQFKPRGQYIGSDPFNKWLKPSCMLVCEDNYSNAHGTPWVYKHLKVGKLVGAPVPGTMTAVWWETQIDNSIVFGIPQVGCWDIENEEYMENVELQPDILIYNAPADVINGFDAQLKAATESLME